MVSLLRIVAGPLDTNSYLVIGREEAWAIDPGPQSARKLLDEAERRGVRISLIIDTHSHWDHTADNARLQRMTGARLAVHRLDRPGIEQPGSTVPLDFELDESSPDVILDDGQGFLLDGSTFTVLHTPGHTPGSICLYNKKENILFSGDTLFPGGYGSTDFPGGDGSQMAESLRTLAALPPETVFHPGHGKSSTIGEERWLSHYTR